MYRLFIFTLGIALAGVVIARQCFPSYPPSDPSIGKQVEIQVNLDAHPHFRDDERRCTHYLDSYFAEGYRSMGMIPPTKEACLKSRGLTSLSSGFAPLGSFFKLKLPVGSNSIRSILWQVKSPGGLLGHGQGMNFAYLFENPGVFSVSVEVSLLNGAVLRDEVPIKVWTRKGRRFFVDSEIGDDRYDGQSVSPDIRCDKLRVAVEKCRGPWRTATRAFGTLAPRAWVPGVDGNYSVSSVCATYSPEGKEVTREASEGVVCEKLRGSLPASVRAGDAIYFRRGQTFDFQTALQVQDASGTKVSCLPMVMTGHWPRGVGLLFAAHGAGAKPVIRNTSSIPCDAALAITGVGMIHLAIQDLEFDLQPPSGSDKDTGDLRRSTFIDAPGQMINFVLNRVSVKRVKQGLLLHSAHGVFIYDSSIYDSSITQIYSDRASNLSIERNSFDYSANHLLYMGMGNARVLGNRFSRPAFGRTALRVFGADPDEFHARNVYIANNIFEGWMDPRTQAKCISGGVLHPKCPFADGSRFNWSLVELMASSESPYFLDHVSFVGNQLRNAETMLRFGNVAGLTVSHNLFENDDSSSAARVQMHSKWSRRPLRDIRIDNNLFLERSRSRPKDSPLFSVTEVSPGLCDDQRDHQAISIAKNAIVSAVPFCALSLVSRQEKLLSCPIRFNDMSSERVLSADRGIDISGNSVKVGSTPSEFSETLRKWLANSALPAVY